MTTLSKAYNVVDIIIKNYSSVNKQHLSVDDALKIINDAKNIFEKEETVLNLNGNFTIVGDIHGNINSLLKIFNIAGFPDTRKFLFLGDYVDRGKNSVEVILMLFSLKCIFPENIYLIRGNHECREINSRYGFKEECMIVYDYRVFEAANDCFDNLPLASLVDNEVFCVHGGISGNIHNYESLFSLQKFNGDPNIDCTQNDFLWSDPSEKVNGFRESPRGSGKLFGKDQLNHFIEVLGISLIIRAHEACKNGFKLPFGENENIITVFSSANYCEYNNKGAFAYIKERDPKDIDIKIFSNKEFEKKTIPSFIIQHIAYASIPLPPINHFPVDFVYV